MSLSHQNGTSIRFGRIELPEDFPCPECDKPTLRRVREQFDSPGGTHLEDLERIRCLSCGEEFFDIEAMRLIEAARPPKARPRKTLHKSASAIKHA